MTAKKRRVALIFGGKSTEHEVSLTSALGILKHIDRAKYDVLLIKISRTGRWEYIGTDLGSLDTVDKLDGSTGPRVFAGDPEEKGFSRMEDASSTTLIRESVDVVFPILHGTFGEDGTVQGTLSLAGLPFVGAGVLSSSLCMDKVMMKQMFFQNDLASPDYMWFLRKDWEANRKTILRGVMEEIGLPCFVKAANSGSSVGVFKVKDEVELPGFIDRSAEYDRKILVEKAVIGRELECSVLGNDAPEASVVGEIIPCNEFYDYDAKYILEESQTIAPADLPETISEEVRRMAVAAFKALDCAGMARVDFLLEGKNGRVFLNEINTIPGFTPISMYPKLWEKSGISYTALIDRLIELGLERHDDIQRCKFGRE